jgi:hypothetical protein
VQLGALVAACRILGHVIDLRVDGHAPGSFTRPPGHLPVGEVASTVPLTQA